MSDLEDLQRKLAALELRMADVEAGQAIQNLKSRYGQLADSRYDLHSDLRSDPRPEKAGIVDDASLDRIAREISLLFTEDATWDGGSGLGVCRGREEIYERFRAPTLKFSWHYFVKPKIDVDGDAAHATWDILALCTTRDDRPMWMAGFEEDTYLRQDGVWLHESMKLSVVFMAPHDRGWAKRPTPVSNATE